MSRTRGGAEVVPTPEERVFLQRQEILYSLGWGGNGGERPRETPPRTRATEAAYDRSLSSRNTGRGRTAVCAFRTQGRRKVSVSPSGRERVDQWAAS
jgi:hypothetical protein